MENKVSSKEKSAVVLAEIFKQYDFVYVESMESYYYKSKDRRLFVPLRDKRLSTIVRDAYIPLFGVFTSAEVENINKVLKISVEEERDDFDRSIVMVSDYTYWDAEQGELTSAASRPCFFRLFNTKVPTKHVVTVPPFTKEQDERMWAKYNDTLALLDSNQMLPIEYDFVKVWANGAEDVYQDMMRAIAYCFVKKKPLGSYVLVGSARGGKSSYTGLLHTIFGAQNTSMVQLTQLGDPHHTHTLLTTLMNAPDEEDDKAITEKAFFKTVSDHGQLKLPVMRSNVPVTLSADFMNFFPMNHIPEWDGTGADACIKRTLVLPFYADLSENDKRSENFAEETYTADMLCDFMGTVFGLAYYYSRHPFVFGDTMRIEQNALMRDSDSCLTYRKEWEKLFDGFQSDRLLFDDYANWCKANDVPIKTMKELKFVFRQYKTKRSLTTVDGKKINLYRIPQPNHRSFVDTIYLPELGRTIDSLLTSDLSAVQSLLDYYDAKGWDKL